MTTVISVENLTKRYDLGVIGTGTLSRDLNRWWARLRGKPDPYTRIGQRDHFERIGESILALDDVSFKVEQGEALGIIGKNGAGKSTLLKILSRVTAPTSGVVKVKGRIGSLLEVGTGFHPELTGRENVYLNGAILGMRKEEVNRKFDEIVDFSGVEKFIDTPVKRYSSGMYVRLAFAVAAHLDPEILVVDEVLAVGDAEFQKKCLGKMGDVASEGRTVLFVSHNMAAVEQLTKRSLVLHSGSLLMNSNTNEAVSFYLNDFQNNHGKVYTPSNSKRLSRHERKVEFVKVEFQDSSTQIFSSTDKIAIMVTLKANETIENFRINLTIFQRDGRPVGAFFGPQKLKMIRNTKKSYRVLLPNLPLAPGKYYFGMSVGLGSYLDQLIDFDILLEVLDFQMKLSNLENNVLLNWNRSWGTIKFESPVISELNE